MSGTSYGACILHVSPESYVGGNLALVQTGDMITLDVNGRTADARCQRCGAGAPPRCLDGAAAALRARLWLDVQPATSARRMRAATSTSWKRRLVRR